MATVKIDYSEIAYAAKRAKDVANSFNDCANSTRRKLENPLNNVPGSDSCGHISTASAKVASKRGFLERREQRFNNIHTNINNLNKYIKDTDERVKTGVATIAENSFELKGQSPFQAFCQWVYGVVCVDAVNWNPITRWIGDKLKQFNDWASNKLNKVYEWFKYGNGRYILNIVTSVIGTALAIYGAYSAIMLCVAATVATGGLAAPLLIAAIAATIGAVMSTGDTLVVIKENVKALKISKQNEDPGRARFYGDISGVNDATHKYDFGGKTANNVTEGFGVGYDVVHTTADVVALGAGMYGQAGLEENLVRDSNGHIIRKEYSYSNETAKTRLKTGFKERFGFKSSGGKDTWDVKNLFKKRKTGALYRDKLFKEHLMKDYMGKETYNTVQKSEKVFKNIKKAIDIPKNIDKTLSHSSTIKDRVEGFTDIIKNANNIGGRTIGDIDKLYGFGKDYIEIVSN